MGVRILRPTLHGVGVYAWRVHLRRVHIENLRSIRELEWEFEAGKEAGWHVVLGNNGAGKSSVLRAIAVGYLNLEKEALRQSFHRW
ncbi:MAG: AAA family ATPase [Deltaproteobacteria bacterium]|nr:AAA family ATPase [Deltaproteobacteria bacterium]